jgi:AAA+ ATPase superfamily predicted ATPase
MSEYNTKDFIDRERGLELLEEAWGRDAFALVVVYGRRRVGKTRLLLEFATSSTTRRSRRLSRS